MKKYPTAWQRKTMWAALTALFVTFLIFVTGSVVWTGAKLIGFLQPILIPVAIAAILAYLLDPVVTHLCQRGFGRTKSIAVIFIIAFLAVTALLTWLVPVVYIQSANAAKELPGYMQKARDGIVDVIFKYQGRVGAPKGKPTSPAASFVNWLLPSSATPAPREAATPAAVPESSPASEHPATPLRAQETIAATPPKFTSAERQQIQDWVQTQLPNLERQLPTVAAKFWELLRTSIGGFLGITGFLLSLVMVPIYLFFFLKERPAIERRWKDYLPLRNSPLKNEVAAVLTQINNYVIAYFRGQLLVCLINGILIGTALTLFGLNFAPLIGLLVVFLTMIPYVGIIICWIPAVLIAAGQFGDWWHPFWVTAIFLAVQNFEAIFIAPKIVGDSVGLHPMTVIVSIFVWGLLIGGLLGPILAVPLTATVKVLLARYVWGRRLRERVAEAIEEVPVVRAAEEAEEPARA